MAITERVPSFSNFPSIIIRMMANTNMLTTINKLKEERCALKNSKMNPNPKIPEIPFNLTINSPSKNIIPKNVRINAAKLDSKSNFEHLTFTNLYELLHINVSIIFILHDHPL